jgi:uncharacterized Zn finger protein (UPF0148 family)
MIYHDYDTGPKKMQCQNCGKEYEVLFKKNGRTMCGKCSKRIDKQEAYKEQSIQVDEQEIKDLFNLK